MLLYLALCQCNQVFMSMSVNRLHELKIQDLSLGLCVPIYLIHSLHSPGKRSVEMASRYRVEPNYVDVKFPLDDFVVLIIRFGVLCFRCVVLVLSSINILDSSCAILFSYFDTALPLSLLFYLCIYSLLLLLLLL